MYPLLLIRHPIIGIYIILLLGTIYLALNFSVLRAVNPSPIETLQEPSHDRLADNVVIKHSESLNKTDFDQKSHNEEVNSVYFSQPNNVNAPHFVPHQNGNSPSPVVSEKLEEFRSKRPQRLNKTAFPNIGLGVSSDGLIKVIPPLAGLTDSDKLVKWYSLVLDLMIAKLEDLTSRTEDPSQLDLERVACANGLNSFIRHINSPWALHKLVNSFRKFCYYTHFFCVVLDSSSKLQSGLLQGNMNDLGQYDECVGVSVQANQSDPFSADFTGQHCLVSFNLHVPNNTITLEGKTRRLVELFGSDWIPVTFGQCYPSLCKPWVLEEVLNSVLSVPDSVLKLFGEDYSVDVSVNSQDCHVKEKEPLDALDWTVAVIILFFIFIAALCTAYDYFYITNQLRNRQATPVEELLLAFSVYTNGGKLLDTRYSADAMTALNGMKVLSIAWVVLGHRYRFLINQPLMNLLDFPDELRIWAKQILFSGPLSVDTFFLISGLLNMYSFAIIREKRRFTPLETVISYIHRFLRLTPAYLVMIGISATWLYRTGDGPYWDRLVGKTRNECRSSYWQNLVYLNNYLNPVSYCMMQSWYLSADMQMFWLSPLVIYPLWKWPIFGFIEVAVLMIASILSPLLISYFYEIRSPIPLTTDKERADREMAYLYLPTHTKTISYVVGILAGYILYNIKKEKIKFKPNKVTQIFFWLASAVFMLYAMFGGYTLYQLEDNYNRIYSAFYIGFYRFFWAIGLVWIMIACISGYGGPVNRVLSWPPLGPIARLTYCVYLTHVAVILRGIASQRSPVYYSDYNQVELYLGDLLISFGAAAALSLLFEAPMMKIEKLIFGGGFRKRPRPRAPPSEANNNSV